MPANLIWGVLLIVVVLSALAWLPAIALVALLAVPVAGIYRMAALTTRGASVGFGDFVTGMRRFALPALTLGAASTFVGAAFTINIGLGLSRGDILGGVFAVLALYADVALAMYLVVAWPILVDPVREAMTFREHLRLAFLVAVTRIGRLLGLTLVILLILLVSAVLFAALVTISVAYVSLVASRYVLPAADRFEGRPTVLIGS